MRITRPVTKRAVGIDLDGVCANFARAYNQMTFKMFGLPDPIDSPQTTWHPTWLTKDQEDASFVACLAQENFWETLDPMPGTNLLRDAQQYFQLYFVSNRAKAAGRGTELQSMLWLRKHFDIGFPQVIVTKDKAPVVNALSLSVFIDDNTTNCENLAVHTSAQVYVKDAPYNQDLTNAKIIRVPTLDAFLEALN